MKAEVTKGYSLGTSIFLAMLMGCVAYVFLVSMNRDPLKAAAAWSLWIFIVAIFFLIMHTGDVSKYRRIFFMTNAVLFFPSFIARLIEERGSMSFGPLVSFSAENPFCHRAIPASILPQFFTGEWIFPAGSKEIYMMLLIWLVGTLTIGKGWCSWICWYGGWDDGFSGMAKKPRIPVDHRNDRFRYFSFAMLAFLVLASLASMAPVLCIWICPFKVITEYAEIVNGVTLMMFMIALTLFAVMAVVLPFLTKKRTQCTLICPFFAFQSLMDRFSLYRIRVDTEKCTGCMRCVKECPTLSMKEDDIKNRTGKTVITCTKCGTCIDRCGKQAIEYVFRGFDNRKGKTADEARKTFFSRIASAFGKSVSEILSPRALFTFSAMTLSMIIMSAYVVGTLHRAINFVINGSFLLR